MVFILGGDQSVIPKPYNTGKPAERIGVPYDLVPAMLVGIHKVSVMFCLGPYLGWGGSLNERGTEGAYLVFPRDKAIGKHRPETHDQDHNQGEFFSSQHFR